MASNTTTPEVTWAQRSSESSPEKNIVYLTIVAPDVPPAKAKIDLQPTYISFTGESKTKKTTYQVKLEFFADIDVKESQKHHSDRDIAFVLRKKDQSEEYWPRLTKDKQRLHFLKTDFDKWVDADEQDAQDDDAMMSNLQGMNGMGTDGGFGGIDFSKLGGGGGMPNMGEEEEDDDDDDDEAMPDLEHEEEASPAATSSSKAKIQEVK